MKRLFTRAAMLLTVAATAFTFTACNDDNDGPEPFKSELIGSYKPTPVTMTIPDVVDDPSDFYFILLPTWSDPENIPGIDMSESMGMPAGSFVMPMNTICGLIQSMASAIVKGGLDQLDLGNDGSFGANYYDLVIKTDGSGEPDIISSLMDPTFGTELKTFPGAATAELLPEGALGYYTKNSRFYFTISKDFLKGVSAELDVLSIVDEMIKTYKLDRRLLRNSFEIQRRGRRDQTLCRSCDDPLFPRGARYGVLAAWRRCRVHGRQTRRYRQ